MSTHNIGFYEDSTKIIFQLSSNMHLISSAEHPKYCCNHPKMLTLANVSKTSQSELEHFRPKFTLSGLGLQCSHISL